jgi:hypothetical protein
MTKTVLVFVVPPPARRGQEAQATPEAYRAAMDMVKDGTAAIVMAEPGGIEGPTVAYGDLFNIFGVTPKFNAVAVHMIPSGSPRAPDRTLPQLDVTSYPSHAITRSLAGLPSAIVMASPLVPAKEMPEGVTVQPLLVTPGGSDYWATTNTFGVAQRQTVKFNPAEDIPGPVTLAVAVTRDLKGGQQRAVLVGGHFAEDQIAQYRLEDPETHRVFMPFPGDTELFLNSALWVTNSENLIAAGPEILQARRIGELGSWETPLKFILIGGLPVIVIFIGIVVYIVRRR